MVGTMQGMGQPMYGNGQVGAYTQPLPQNMNAPITNAGITGAIPATQMGQAPAASIPTPSQPTQQRTASSLSGISRPTAPLESKVEAKSIKIPDFLKNNK